MYDFIRFRPRADLRIDLPVHVKNRISRRTLERVVRPEPRTPNSVCVRYDDVEAKTELYQALCVGDDPVATADRIVAASRRADLDAFAYYRVRGGNELSLRHGHFNARETPSSCAESRVCPFGADLSPPVMIEKLPGRAADWYEMGFRWFSRRHFLISRRLYELFNENGVTGLEYLHTEIAPGLQALFPDGGTPVAARASHFVHERARRFMAFSWTCEAHRYPFSRAVFDPALRAEDLNGLDFAEVTGVEAEGATYRWMMRDRIVSTRVVKMMRRAGIKGLRRDPLGDHQPFEPVPTHPRGLHPILGTRSS